MSAFSLSQNFICCLLQSFLSYYYLFGQFLLLLALIMFSVLDIKSRVLLKIGKVTNLGCK